MTFATLYAEVAEILGDSSAAMVTRVKEWINNAQQDVATAAWWPWLLKEATIVISADIDDGTASVTNGDATVDLSDEYLPTAMGAGQWYFQVDDDDEWYPVASRTDADTFELSSDYQGDTDTEAEYTLRRMIYSLPSDCYAIASFRQQQEPRRIRVATFNDLDLLDPNNDDSGTDTYLFIPFGVDATGYPQGYFFPPTTSATIRHLRYYRKLTDLSGDTDVSLIPSPHHEILKYGALRRGWEFLQDPEGMMRNLQLYERELSKMKSRVLAGANEPIVVGKPITSGYLGMLSRLNIPVSTS